VDGERFKGHLGQVNKEELNRIWVSRVDEVMIYSARRLCALIGDISSTYMFNGWG